MFDRALAFFVVIAPTLFALVLEIVDEKIRKHRFWRFGVVAFGLVISGATWWQMSRQEASASVAQESAIERVATETSKQVSKAVGDEYQKMITDLTMQIQSLKDQLGSQTRSLSDQLSKQTTDLSGRITKVGTPVTKYAQLQFSFWSDIAPLPVTTLAIPSDADGVFPVDFTVTDIADTAAMSVDIWIQICEACTFATEPNGFQKPLGVRGTVRTRNIPLLNPGVSFEKMHVDIKAPKEMQEFAIAFRYSCATCGKMADSQMANIRVTNPLPVKFR